jgi:hypothetical protein
MALDASEQRDWSKKDIKRMLQAVSYAIVAEGGHFEEKDNELLDSFKEAEYLLIQCREAL